VVIEELKELSDQDLVEINILLSQLTTGKSITKDDLETLIKSECSTLLVAKMQPDKAPVGMLTLVTFRIPTGLKAQIEDVVVRENLRGKGIGKALVLKALELAKAKGAKSVDLTSRPERVEANSLYVSVGFKKRVTNVYRYEL
jgi:ribosomal protein S18 acetylase RimI-like enzyme